MKRAWAIYKDNNSYSRTFSDALTRAWEIEKANISYELRKAAEAESRVRMAAYHEARRNRPVEVSASYEAGVAAYYANARPGQYFGD